MSEWRNYMQLLQMNAKKNVHAVYIFLIYKKKKQNGNKVE